MKLPWGVSFYYYERPVRHCNFSGDVFWERKDASKELLISKCPQMNGTLLVLDEIYTMAFLWGNYCTACFL